MPSIGVLDGPPPFDHLLNAQVIGVSELGAFLRVAHQQTVWKWKGGKGRSRQLPPPDFPSVNGNEAWRRLTVVRWAAHTGRLPPWLEDEGAPFAPQKRKRRSREELEAAGAR